MPRHRLLVATPWGVPNALLLFVPVAAAIIFTLRRTGFGRLLYAVGDNEKATRLSGVVYWKVIVALYVISSLLAGIMGLLYVGLIKAPSLSLVEPLVLPSVAAAVIGGTSIFGGRGGYTGTIIGALILTVLTTLLSVLQMPEGARRMEKSTFSCCDEAAFEDLLQGTGRPVPVIFGIETHICILATVLDLLEQGRKVVLASDACGSRDPLKAERALSAMTAAGALVVPVESVIYHLMGRSGTAEFKELLPLFKE